MDRLRAVGNAIVPQIAANIGRAILDWEHAHVREPEPTLAPTAAISQTKDLRRGRGRPRIGDAPLSKSERNKRWRENNRIAALEVPVAIAERLRRLREERGLSNADILAAALDALITRTPAISPDTSTTLDA